MVRTWALGIVGALASCGSDPALVDGGPDPTGDGAAAHCTLPALDQTVATLAGCDQSGAVDGPRGIVRFDNPTNVVIAPGGVTYVTDFDGNLLRAVDPTGMTTTVIKRETFTNPFGITLGPGGTLYVETDDNDLGSHSTTTGTVWRVDPVAKTADVIARDLGRPRGLVVLGDGRIAMADHMHHVVSILDPVTGTVTPLAGALDQPGYANATGAAARFAQPYDLVLLPDGDLVVTDMDNHRLRRITLAGVVTDYAGSGAVGAINGPVAVATFDAPQGLALAPDGTLYVSDIRLRLLRRIRTGQVTTIAGDGTPGWIDSDDPRAARFYGLEGVDTDGSRLVIADGNIGDGMPFHHVRVVDLTSIP